MISSANRYTAVLDANVLFPRTKRDLLLLFHGADLFRARWSEMIHMEWVTRAKDRYPEQVDGIARSEQLMRQSYEDCWLETGSYEMFIDKINLPDPDDRHVVAAAIACKAQSIVTDDLGHFPDSELDRFDLERMTADDFLATAFDLYPNRAVSILANHRGMLKRSNPSPERYVDLLQKRKLPKLAARADEMQGSL